jgi:hypothetical protein
VSRFSAKEKNGADSDGERFALDFFCRKMKLVSKYLETNAFEDEFLGHYVMIVVRRYIQTFLFTIHPYLIIFLLVFGRIATMYCLHPVTMNCLLR